MNESVLRIILKLFAISSGTEGINLYEREVVQNFLKALIIQSAVPFYLSLFEQYSRELNTADFRPVCRSIAAELSLRQKHVLLMHFLILIYADSVYSEEEQELVRIFQEELQIPAQNLADLNEFISNPPDQITHPENLLVISKDPGLVPEGAQQILAHTLNGMIGVLHLPGLNICFMRYFGEEDVLLNHQLVLPGNCYVLSSGAVVSLPEEHSIYYGDILARFLPVGAEEYLSFTVRDLNYQFKNGKTGIKGVSIEQQSGQLVAIMGGSGSGKTTLLNLMNGELAPSTGEVFVNGFNLHKNLDKLKGMIGYVPQDDLLIEELTVYQNLYFNARLCFNDLGRKALDVLVSKVLEDLGLSHIRDQKVGTPLEKEISGGERKRLNIGLELCRQPSIIFFDEPTSGLSSRDSENIMGLLKELTLKGKLVFVVIHQPSSEVFKLFDRLLILDQGGLPVYYGNPVEAVNWFRKKAGYIQTSQAACPECGNINPEQIFNILEARVLDEYGNFTSRRKISPKEWNQEYIKHEQETGGIPEVPPKRPPSTLLKTPGWLRQFGVFFKRDMMAKLGNYQYLTVNVFEAPLLAIILGLIVRYYHAGEDVAGEYMFGKNDNIPVYFFMSIVVALFIGLTMSAEEIIRDGRILKRESFLNLSRSSYLTAKALILFLIAGIEMLAFVVIGDLILDIPGLHLEYWVLLFSLAGFAIMLGLNISSMFDSAVTIYIVLPLLLIPQLILSGTIVRFDKLNPQFSSEKHVPLAADLMASRWGYEALMVMYFRDNDYTKPFFPYDVRISTANYMKDYWAPHLESVLDHAIRHFHEKGDSIEQDVQKRIHLIADAIDKEQKRNSRILPINIEELREGKINRVLGEQIRSYLHRVRYFYIDVANRAHQSRDSVDYMLNKQFPTNKAYIQFTRENHNEAVDKLVRNEDSDKRFLDRRGQLIRTYQPVYFRDDVPASMLDYRSHFYAPQKHLFGRYFDTVWFNLIVIWLMILFLYFTLYLNLFRRVVLRLKWR